MRWHLAVAVASLAVVVAGGVWYARESQSPSSSDPVRLRDEIGQSSAVVVTFGAGGASNVFVGEGTLTMIRGQGWVWHREASEVGTPAATVISTNAHTLTAVAPGCYVAIPAVIAPRPLEVPGVNLVAHLEDAPGLKHTMSGYQYEVRDAGGSGFITVSEDLGGIAQQRSYTARVAANQSSLGSAAATGVYTVREATAAERAAASKLMAGAEASPVTPLQLDVRVVRAGEGDANSSPQELDLVSPRDCVSVFAPDYSRDTPSSPSLLTSFGEGSSGIFLRASLVIDAHSVMVRNAVAIADFTAPVDALAEAFLSPDRTSLAIAQGATFGVVTTTQDQFYDFAVHVVSCTPSAWFPCG